MIANDHWIRTRRELLTQVKKQVELRIGPPPEDLVAYSEPFLSEFVGDWQPAHWAEFLVKVAKSRIVLGSDFHAFVQSQRTHLRILRSLPTNIEVVLGLECVEACHQEVLDQYMAGFLDESSFLNRVQWEEHWGFPFENYKPLFDLARSRLFKVVALNSFEEEFSEETLHNRDDVAVKVIARQMEVTQHNQNSLIYVIFGEYHLASPHLPQKLKQQTSEALESPLIIYQNNESLYFDLAEQGLENKVHVLKGEGNKWCLLGSPPWVQWQSYLMFLEEVYDIELSDDEDDDEDEGIDYTDHLLNQVEFIVKDLKIEGLKFDDIQVYSSGDFEVWDVLGDEFPLANDKVMDWLIKSDRSFIIPKTKMMYLSRRSINHLAELAGKYLHVKLSSQKKTFWNMPSDFKKNILVEAIGFFTSKLVNHHRKADTLLDLKSRLGTLHPEDGGKEALLLAVDQRLCEILTLQSSQTVERRFQPKGKKSFFEAAKILGSMLGEKIFLAYRAERIGHDQILDVFKISLADKDFDKHYMNLVQLVEDMDSPSSQGGVIYER